tara:strand:- start:6320 stop:6553 length:234 start_codon:yes stop_codon:yes gene_type:complete
MRTVPTRTLVHLQDTDFITADLNEAQDGLSIEIGNSDGVVQIFCLRPNNEELFDDLVELFRPIISLKKERDNDPETE